MNIENTVNTAKTFIKDKYLDLGYKLVVNHVLPLVNSFMRQLIVAKGKNPDYIAPPPPQEEFTLEWAFEPSTRNRVFSLPAIPAWVSTSFEDPNKHPVIKHRNNRENPPSEVRQVAVCDPITDLQKTIEELEKTRTLPNKEERQACIEKFVEEKRDEALSDHLKKLVSPVIVESEGDLKRRALKVLAIVDRMVERKFISADKESIRRQFGELIKCGDQTIESLDRMVNKDITDAKVLRGPSPTKAE